MLITIHLAKVRAPTRYSLIPAVFMIITTLAALAWQVYFFTKAVVDYLNGSSTGIFGNVRAPINKAPYALVALGINAVFVVIGAVLFLVGLSMARSEEHTSELQSQFHLVCRL